MRIKRIILVVTAAVLVLSLMSTCTGKTSSVTGVSIGNRAPDFQLRTLTGQTVSLSSLRGKPVLINFWATWCGPCKAEMPYLQQINDTWSAKGLVLLAVDIGEKPATIEKFMTELNLSMTVPMDSDGKVARAYLVGAIPTTFLIDKDGVIRQKVVGAFTSVEAIEKELSKIMP
ncbi:MAG: redoxin domain-containing protein [Dehalococcoidales bacterium]|nr:redoxin domain-containing protein [Dehalococcoidales bacterium]